MKHHARISSSSHRDRKTLEERRLKAAKLFAKGRTQTEVARELGVSCEAARKWQILWKKHGIKGLSSKGKPGPKSQLTDAKFKRIEQALLKGPQKYGYDTDIWTLGRIQAVIKQVTGVSYGTTHTWRILTNVLGWSNQKPETRAVERDEDAIRHWKRYTWPQVKKKREISVQS